MKIGKKVEQSISNQIKKMELFEIVKIAISMYVNKFWLTNVKSIEKQTVSKIDK